MTRHERLLEAYEDALFSLLMEDVMLREGKRLEALNRTLLEDPSAAVPESLDQKCRAAIARWASGERRRSALRLTGKALRAAAVLAAILSVLFTSAFALSEDFRNIALSVVVRTTQRFAQVDIKGHTGESSRPPSFPYFENTALGWLPDGYIATREDYDHSVRFEDSNGQFFDISVSPGSGSMTLYTLEDADVVEDITINGEPALYVVNEKMDAIDILITDLTNDLYIYVSGTYGVTEKVIRKIAENIQYFPPPEPLGTELFYNLDVTWIPEGFHYKDGLYSRYAYYRDSDSHYFGINWFYGNELPAERDHRGDPVAETSYGGNPGLYMETERGDMFAVVSFPEYHCYVSIEANYGVPPDTVCRIAEGIVPTRPAGKPAGFDTGRGYISCVEFGWIPEGFQNRSSHPINDHDFSADFVNALGDAFLVDVRSGLEDPSGLEGSDSYEWITVNGNPTVCFTTSGWPHVILMDEAHNAQIRLDTGFEMPMETAVKIVENISILSGFGQQGGS